MKLKGWAIPCIIGSVLLIMAGTYLWTGSNRLKVSKEAIPKTSKTPDTVVESELLITSQGNTTTIASNSSYKGRTPFYLEENNFGNNQFNFMFYYSDQRSLFYSFKLQPENTATAVAQKIFEVQANIDSGEVVNEGKGLVYRELTNDSYVEGDLKYLKSDGSTVTIVNQCIFYSVAPDKKQVLAGGKAPDAPDRARKQFYLFNLVTAKRTPLTGVFCPQNFEELIGVKVAWSRNSRYLCLIDKLFDTNTGGAVKRDFATAGAVPTLFCWSPDGQKLAYLYQLDRYANYSIDLENTSVCLSDRVVVYNPEDGRTQYWQIGDGLALDFIWSDDSRGIIAKVVPAAQLDTFINNYRPENFNPEVEAERFDLIAIDLQKPVAEKVLDDYPVRNLNKYYDGKLLFTYLKKNHSFIGIYDLKSKVTMDLMPGGSLNSYSYNDKVVFTVPEGIYLLDKDLKAEQKWRWDQSYPLLLFPGQQKAVFTTNDLIRVVDLSSPPSADTK
ncbi:MAG TPA: hypothetical protein VIM29_12425 [Bacillota bacterium]